MIIFGSRTKLLENNSNHLRLDCSSCNNKDTVRVVHYFKYFHVFWIPAFAYATGTNTQCEHCKRVKYQKELTPQEIDQIRHVSKTKVQWYYNTLLILFVLLALAIPALTVYNSYTTKNRLQHPLVGDIYKVEEQVGLRKVYAIYKVKEIQDQVIIFEVNSNKSNTVGGLKKLYEEHKDQFEGEKRITKIQLIEMRKKHDIISIDRE